MKEQSKSTMVLLLSLALLLVALPLNGPYAEAKPKPQGTLAVSLPSLGVEGFLPDIGGSQQSFIWELVFDHLLYVNMKTREPIPGLAKRFEYSKDYRVLTFWLREGTSWPDGWGKLTAEDVKYTIERVMRKGSTNTKAGEFRKKIEKIEIKDPYTIAIHLKKVDPVFWLQFTIAQNPWLPIVCKKYVEKVGEQQANLRPVGSGPYRLVEHEVGDFLKFEALEEHWRVVPEFKYLILRVVPEESTAVAMLKTGELDIAPVSVDKTAELREAKPKREVKIWPGGYCVYLIFGNIKVPEDSRYTKGVSNQDPWKDIRVREAMNIAIDRKAIAKALYSGTARPAKIWALCPGREELEPIPYDPKRAKQLLAEAGYPDGFSFELASCKQRPGVEIPRVAEAVAAYWEAIGLKPKITLADYADRRLRILAGKDAGLIWTMRTAFTEDFSYRMKAYHVPDGSVVVHPQIPELIASVKRLENELDYKKRNALIKEIARYERDNYLTVPVVIASPVWGYNPQKVGEWSANMSNYPANLVYIRHAEPLNTWRLFSP